jgi:ketosteroid isomerase-like protein
MQGFQVGSQFAQLPRDDVMWAAWCRASAPVLAHEFAYEDDFLPDHAGETYRGVDGLRRAWIGVAEAFEEVTYDLERVVGSGDRVVSIYRVRAKARHTGIVQDYLFAYIWTFRDGRIVHCRGIGDVDEALKAVRLEEQVKGRVSSSGPNPE